MTTVEKKSVFAKWVEDNVFQDWEYLDSEYMDLEAKRMGNELEKMFTDERQKVLEEVEEIIVIVDREERRQAFAKLNQLKGGE